MEELIKYYEKKLEVRTSDLLMSNDDRMILVGQLSMLDEIKEIMDRGYPEERSND